MLRALDRGQARVGPPPGRPPAEGRPPPIPGTDFLRLAIAALGAPGEPGQGGRRGGFILVDEKKHFLAWYQFSVIFRFQISDFKP